MTCSTCVHWRPVHAHRGDCTLIGPGERGPGRHNTQTYADASCDLHVPHNVRDLLAVTLSERAKVSHEAALELADDAINLLKGSPKARTTTTEP